MLDVTSKTKIIVFDLDDTLYKEVDFVLSGYRAVDARVKADYNFDGAFEIMRQAFEAHENPFDALEKAIDGNIDTKALVETYRNHMPDIALSRTTELTLDNLAGEDAVLCLITDGRSTTQRNKIAALKLNRYILDENITISEEIGAEKTERRAFDIIAKKFPQAKQFYYIGDNTAKDFFWPNRMKWTTICIEDNGQNIHKQKFDGDRMHNPQIIISNFYEVPYIIFQ